MKYIFTLSLLCLSLMTSSAQEIFQKALGSTGADYLTDVQRLSNGSYIALGFTKPSGADSTYAQLFRMDSSFNVTWSKTYTFNNQVRLNEIKMAANGGYFLIGRTWQTPTAAAKQGALVVKTDSLGVVTWSRIFKFDGSENMAGMGEEADGSLRFFISSNSTCYFQKADATGAAVGVPTSVTDGAADMTIRRVLQRGPNRYAILGPLAGSDHILMMNQDTIQWIREFSGIVNVARILSITNDATGNLFFAGDYQAGPYVQRSRFVGKINSDGSGRWVTVLPMLYKGGRGPDTVWRYSTAGHIQVVGRTIYTAGYLQNEQKGYSYGMMSAFDTASTTGGGNNWKWSRVYGNQSGLADSFARVIVLPNRQIIGAGNTGLGGNTANPNFYFVKTDSSGISSCNTGSYSPVEEVSSAAFLGINKILRVGIAPALNTLTSFADAIPTTTKAPLGTTTTLCTATLCPAGTVTASVSAATICQGDTLTLTAAGGTSYLWSGLALNPARTDSVVRIPVLLANNLAFSLSVQPRGAACFAAATYNVTVNARPNTGISAARLMCLGDSLSVASGAQGTMVWSSPTNTPFRQVSAGSVMVKPTTFGVQRIRVNVTDTKGCKNSNETTLTVRDNVTPTVTLDPIGCPGPDLTLRARGTNEGAAPFFDWLIDGTTLVGGRRELILPNAIGKKVVVIMNVGADVCPAPPGTRQVRSQLITISCQGVGTKDVALAQNITVFPNPTEGAFSVKINLEQAHKVSFAVRNMLGQVIQTVAPQKVEVGEFVQQFQLNHVAAGLYFVETRLDDKLFLTKIQVQ